MKNVLVIGGAGFLGAALASELKNRGVNVRLKAARLPGFVLLAR